MDYVPCSINTRNNVIEIAHSHQYHSLQSPTLLFERFFKDKPSRRYYACSACRDRNVCSFFQWEDEKVTNGKVLVQKEIKKKLFKKKKKPVKILSEGDTWCYDCMSGFASDKTSKHAEHSTRLLSVSDIVSPSFMINPKDNKKSNAQYFFDEDTCKFFVTTLARLNYKKIVCIGTPRLFEILNQGEENDTNAILLDIDKRFEQFYSAENFLQYNMFNNFFFDATNGEHRLKEFLSSSKPDEILIVIDPPFGGLVNVLGSTISTLWKMSGQDNLATMLVFPYFLESHVESNLDNFQMLDYKVSYEMHPHYNNARNKPRGSPVRIFTNIPADRMALPKEDYRFCKLCQRYVYKENKHCKICKFCTSKDGRTYVHCDECKKCVKPGRVHCKQCERCEPEIHVCGREVEGCHICGEMDHKRRHCPRKEELKKKTTRKRPLQEISKEGKRKKKKSNSRVKIRI